MELIRIFMKFIDGGVEMITLGSKVHDSGPISTFSMLRCMKYILCVLGPACKHVICTNIFLLMIIYK